MKYKFLQDNISIEKFFNETNEFQESILLENNKNQLSKIIDFLNSDTSVLLATGFLGTGKTEVIQHALQALAPDTILLWANCYESTNLDDIFLNFFEEFKRLAAQDVIKVPQAKFENFTQRISAYFYSISKPIVIVLNSFQSLLPENAQQVADFVSHLSEFAKIKTIIISRNFKQEILHQTVKTEKISFKALDKDLFQKYLTANKIRIHGPVLEEFYKLTKGYFFYTTLAVKIISIQGISPIDLIEKQAKSFLSLREFLFKENLAIVDPAGSHLLRFLTVIRYPVNTKLLKSLNLWDENRLQMLAANSLVEIEHGNIYLKDYYKEITEREIPQNVLVKLHRSCAELYEMQLPLKPEERDLLISRRTIRQEIEYHKIFIPKRVELTNSVEIYNGQALMLQAPPQTLKQPQTAEPKQLPPKVTPTQKPKSLKDLLFVFDEEEENSLLSGIANSINEFIKEANAQEELEAQMSPQELLALIREAEQNFDHKRVISLGEKVLTNENCEKNILALTNSKIATAYSKLTDAYNALKHFNAAQNLYVELNDTKNINETTFFIAKINYLMFKHDTAKEILQSLREIADRATKLQTELLLFDIYLEEGLEKEAFDTCKSAMKLIDKSENPKTICELLFKCGLILESRNNTYRAIEAYEKAIKFNNSPEVNPYLQQIYSNLTTLYAETDNLTLAREYGQKALDIAICANKPEGLYNSHLKLAQLNADIMPDKAQNYFKNALEYASELKDEFYTISALVNYGDFLYSETRIVEALENYFNAHKLAKNNFNKENIEQIERRILDVKLRVTEEIFNKKAKEFNYEK